MRIILFVILSFNVKYIFGQIDTTINQIGEFPGGVAKMHEVIRNNLIYPLKAKQDNIQGKCYIRFVVDTLGNPTNIQVQKSLRPDCDSAAIDAVKHLTGWKPSLLKGRKVPIKMVAPINFTLIENQNK